MDAKKRCFYYNAIEDDWQEEPCIPGALADRLKELRIDDQRFSYIYLPLRWSVEMLPDRTVELVLHSQRVTLEDNVITEVTDKEWTIVCDIDHGSVQGWPVSIVENTVRNWRNGYVCGGNITFPELLAAKYVDIPAMVIDIAIGYLQEIAEGKYGFRPSYLGEAHGLLHLFAYCECTLDPSLYLLKDVWGQEAYRAIKEQGRFDVYRELCRFLCIENPPPSLRKAYVRNPESILVYVFLRQCGFTDINIIRRFFYREEIFGYRLLDMRYDTITEALSFSGAGAYEIRSFQRFCRWLLRYRSEKAIAPRVLRWCNDNLSYAAMDTLRMFIEAGLEYHEDLIARAVYRRLLNEGLTQEVHDALVDELFAEHPEIVNRYRDAGGPSKRKNTVYEYKDKELALETELGEYTFQLPKDTNELRKWGNIFHNCVASYDSAVISRWSLIVAMKKQEKYVACIEVKQGRITQALGHCNQRLSVDYGTVIAEWAKGNKIYYRR